MEDFAKALNDVINTVLQKQICDSLKRVKEKHKNNFLVINIVDELMKRYNCVEEKK